MELMGYAIAVVLLIALIDKTRDARKRAEGAAAVQKLSVDKSEELKRYIIRLFFDGDYYEHEVETVRIAIQNGTFNLGLIEQLAKISETECGDPNRECIKKELAEINKPPAKPAGFKDRLKQRVKTALG